MSEYVRIKEDGGVLEITFARPDKKNALTNDMYQAALDGLVAAQRNDAIRAILFSAEGDAFTAGNDLNDFAKIAKGESADFRAQAFIEALARAEKPIIAAVPGLAVGVGTTMLLHCDLVYVTESAKLSAPFVNLALVPEAASSLLLPMRIGYVRAFAMFALGESISGAEAVSLGLANKMVSSEELLPTARAAAKAVAKKPVGSVIATKRLMRDMETMLERMRMEGVSFLERLHSDEAREAFSAFAERRQPDFSKF